MKPGETFKIGFNHGDYDEVKIRKIGLEEVKYWSFLLLFCANNEQIRLQNMYANFQFHK